MGTPFTINTDELADIVSDMARFDADAESTCSDVDALVQKLHASWSGDAAAAQRAAHDRWTKGAQQMRSAIGDLKQSGDTAHANYTGAVAANQAMWS